MNIVWDWALETETDRLLDTTRGIGNGFFTLQHFLPLPWDPNVKYQPACVYLPLLDFQTIPRFWSQVSRLTNHAYPLPAPTKLISRTRALLNTLSLATPATTELQVTTAKVIPQVLTFLHGLVPSAPLPTHILLHPTYLGTGGSFSLIKKSRQITIYLRRDQGIRTIVECLLSSVLRAPAYADLAADWGQTEFLVDWLIRSTALNDLLPSDPSWAGTIASTRANIDSSLEKISADFLAKIGAPISNHQKFMLNDNQILFDNQALPNLTTRETALLTQLIAKSITPLTYDEIGCILFNCDKKFSLAAISKAIERLRTKLDEAGISSHYLATASGTGYYLKN